MIGDSRHRVDGCGAGSQLVGAAKTWLTATTPELQLHFFVF